MKTSLHKICLKVAVIKVLRNIEVKHSSLSHLNEIYSLALINTCKYIGNPNFFEHQKEMKIGLKS